MRAWIKFPFARYLHELSLFDLFFYFHCAWNIFIDINNILLEFLLVTANLLAFVLHPMHINFLGTHLCWWSGLFTILRLFTYFAPTFQFSLRLLFLFDASYSMLDLFLNLLFLQCRFNRSSCLLLWLDSSSCNFPFVLGFRRFLQIQFCMGLSWIFWWGNSFNLLHFPPMVIFWVGSTSFTINFVKYFLNGLADDCYDRPFVRFFL